MLSFCCSPSKKLDPKKSQQILPKAQQEVAPPPPPPIQPIPNAQYPKSITSFKANSYQPGSQINKQQFYPAQIPQFKKKQRPYRNSQYAVEGNLPSHSLQLLSPKQMLTYDLDKTNGISHTAVVNTFHYQATLDHCFINQQQRYFQKSSNLYAKSKKQSQIQRTSKTTLKNQNQKQLQKSQKINQINKSSKQLQKSQKNNQINKSNKSQRQLQKTQKFSPILINTSIVYPPLHQYNLPAFQPSHQIQNQSTLLTPFGKKSNSKCSSTESQNNDNCQKKSNKNTNKVIL